MRFFDSPSLLERRRKIVPRIEWLEQRLVPSVTVVTNFDGMSLNDTTCNCQPPDTIAAVGPNHVVEMVNTAIRISDKLGRVQSTTQLSSFFSSVFIGPHQTDPFVMYDEVAGKFVAGVMDYVNGSTPNRLDFAVSSGDPSSGSFTWTFKNYTVGEVSFFADYPRAGWNADGYFVSFNMFNTTGFGSFSHVQTLTINKVTLAVTSQHDYSSTLFTVTPAVMHGAVTGGPEYFVESSYNGGSTINVIKETNVLLPSPTFTITSVSVPAYKSAPAPVQPGGSKIASFDARIFDAAFRTTSDGVSHLVAAHQIGLSGSKLGYARWYDFNMSGTPKLIQSGNQAGVTRGSTAFMPSVEMNSAGSIGLNFDESSKSEYWSMYVTGRTTAMALGTMQAPVRTVAGTAVSRDSRVGDFSSITVDPSDGLTFWAANEYQGSAFWNTRIASFTVVGTFTAVPANRTITSDIGALPAQPSQALTAGQNGELLNLTLTGVPPSGWLTGSQTMGAAGAATTNAVDALWAYLANQNLLRSESLTKALRLLNENW